MAGCAGPNPEERRGVKVGGKRFSDSVLSIICAGIMCLAANPSHAADEDGDGIIEPGEDETAELARAAQNPIANMISLPFQNNTSFNTGPRECAFR